MTRSSRGRSARRTAVSLASMAGSAWRRNCATAAKRAGCDTQLIQLTFNPASLHHDFLATALVLLRLGISICLCAWPSDREILRRALVRDVLPRRFVHGRWHLRWLSRRVDWRPVQVGGVRPSPAQMLVAHDPTAWNFVCHSAINGGLVALVLCWAGGSVLLGMVAFVAIRRRWPPFQERNPLLLMTTSLSGAAVGARHSCVLSCPRPPHCCPHCQQWCALAPAAANPQMFGLQLSLEVTTAAVKTYLLRTDLADVVHAAGGRARAHRLAHALPVRSRLRSLGRLPIHTPPEPRRDPSPGQGPVRAFLPAPCEI